MIKIKHSVLLVFLVTCFSCSEDNDISTPRNLQDYVALFSDNIKTEGVIACAASASGNTSLTYVFYYPEEGATDIRYYEADSLTIEDENNFANYRKQILTSDAIFGGKLERFSRSGADETWSIVTYVLDGKLHISNPIRHKNTTNETVYKEEVSIENTSSLMPKFTWSDFGIDDNTIYFQVIADDENTFLSGTYTNDNYFQFYDTTNVVLNITTETPASLILNDNYNFTLMGVSKDNWVNLVIQKSFVAQ